MNCDGSACSYMEFGLWIEQYQTELIAVLFILVAGLADWIYSVHLNGIAKGKRSITKTKEWQDFQRFESARRNVDYTLYHAKQAIRSVK